MAKECKEAGVREDAKVRSIGVSYAADTGW